MGGPFGILPNIWDLPALREGLPRTEWAQAGVTGATVTMMLVRGLVERDSTGGLKMTPKGREVFKVLIGG
jgi:hypothetical protein